MVYYNPHITGYYTPPIYPKQPAASGALFSFSPVKNHVTLGPPIEVNVASFGESAAFWHGKTYQLLRDDEKPSMCTLPRADASIRSIRSKIEWDRIPTDPLSKLRKALLDTQVCLRGP